MHGKRGEKVGGHKSVGGNLRQNSQTFFKTETKLGVVTRGGGKLASSYVGTGWGGNQESTKKTLKTANTLRKKRKRESKVVKTNKSSTQKYPTEGSKCVTSKSRAHEKGSSNDQDFELWW